jgi:uncharacterized membrane protein YgdD (TMEM256/DUF423 family)
MPASARLFIALGAALSALAVVLGAFGAHTLKTRLPAEALGIYRTAVEYHFCNALGLIAVGLACVHLPESSWLRAAGWLLAAGVLLFSGSLYLLAISGSRWLGAITPFGGTAFILGWIGFAIAILRG